MFVEASPFLDFLTSVPSLLLKINWLITCSNINIIDNIWISVRLFNPLTSWPLSYPLLEEWLADTKLWKSMFWYLFHPSTSWTLSYPLSKKDQLHNLECGSKQADFYSLILELFNVCSVRPSLIWEHLISSTFTWFQTVPLRPLISEQFLHWIFYHLQCKVKWQKIGVVRKQARL